MNKLIIDTLKLLILLIPFPASSQLLREGTYIGYEKMDVRPMGKNGLRYWPGQAMPSPRQSLENELWFHQVTITIKKDSASVVKVPVVIRDGQIQYSDSIGGFFYYNDCEIKKNNNSSVIIYGWLTSTKYTGIGHRGCGMPYYSTTGYSQATTSGDSLTVKAGNLGKLTFRKVD